jgi:hypothetical protein
MLLHGHLIRLIALFRGPFSEILVWCSGLLGGLWNGPC